MNQLILHDGLAMRPFAILLWTLVIVIIHRSLRLFAWMCDLLLSRRNVVVVESLHVDSVRRVCGAAVFRVDRKRDKLDRQILDSQERAFWDVHRPAVSSFPVDPTRLRCPSVRSPGRPAGRAA